MQWEFIKERRAESNKRMILIDCMRTHDKDWNKGGAASHCLAAEHVSGGVAHAIYVRQECVDVEDNYGI